MENLIFKLEALLNDSSFFGLSCGGVAAYMVLVSLVSRMENTYAIPKNELIN